MSERPPRRLKSSKQNIFHNTQGPNIMDSRYDSSGSTWYYRERPRLYNDMSHYYSNPRLFGYPRWYEEYFTNPSPTTFYIVVLILLLMCCYF